MTTTSDPFLASAREVIERSQREMRDAIADLPTDALNWRPAGPDSNSIAVLATHALHSTRFWLVAVALAQPLPQRDREAEFRAETEGPDTLLAFTDAILSDCLAVLDFSPAVDWSAFRQAAPNSAPSAAWCLLHALEHLREHVGQMLLTRQLWEHAPRSP